MLSKLELENLLNQLNIVIHDGIQSDVDSNIIPRILYWDYVWEPNTASSTVYNTKVTYQISFFSNCPRHDKLIELIKLLATRNIFPIVEHEYNEETRTIHSFFAIEVLEEI